MQKLLFVCSRNKLRSPTAEHIFSQVAGIESMSAGVNHDAENPITPELIEWADKIFVMESAHRRKLQNKFKQYLHDKKIICLGIPDDYEYMEPALIEVLKRKVNQFIE